MPAGIEAVVEDGFATLDFTDRTLLGPALAKLAEDGVRVTKQTRVGPRARYVLPEGDAVAAGLIDGATAKPPALAHGDTGFAAALAGVGSAGARPEQPTSRNTYVGATPAAAVMAVPGPATTVKPPAPAAAGDPDPSWTVAELRQFAADNGIDLGEATKKTDILAAITAAV